MRRRLLRIGLPVVLLALVATTVVAASIVVYRPLPTVDADMRLLGLHERVEVVRDENGVAHVYARDAHDLFFTQGYVTAQDRLFQMDLYRRTGRGSLAQVVGAAGLESDRFTRTVGFLRAAEADAPLLSAGARLALDSYAEGVNKFLEQHGESLPIEFTLLGYRPEPWSAVDSLLMTKLQAYDLATNYKAELLRSDLALRVGSGAVSLLMPDPGRAASAAMDEAWALVAPLLSLSGQPDLGPATALVPLGLADGSGSNCFALSGARTASGKPLLEGDPHLSVRNPAIWYEIALDGDAYHLVGFSLPGIPGIGIGHNDTIAWTFTVAYADLQDLFVEQLDPNDPRRYRVGDTYESARFVREEIRVKGRAEPVILDVTITRHGPIISPVLKGQAAPLALRWTALDPGRSMDALLALNRAVDWTSFKAALADLSGAALSACYADTSGHIGYLLAGQLPRRAAGDGSLPVPGWTGQFEWLGALPQSANPSVFDPPGGLIVNANDRPTADPSSAAYFGEWDPGFRRLRLDALIGARTGLTAEDARAIQNDIVSLPVARGRESILGARPRSPLAATAQSLVRDWDGRLDAGSGAAAIYETWALRMADVTFRDKLGDPLFEDYLANGRVLYALYLLEGRPNDPWFVSLTDQSMRGRDELASVALELAVKDLRERLGADPARWHWGDLHQISFEHPLSAGLPGPLKAIFNVGPFPRAGDGYSLDQSAYSAAKPFAQTSHPSERMIVDLGDLDASWSVLPLGQSGQPFARHSADQTPLWRDGRLHPMRFSRDRLGTPEGTLILRPG
ncbi:MAG: penicillin acylase family protein [Chloroflexi bacterium]|nr:penicillin acylase family protein [Chloroflexota bacterium]